MADELESAVETFLDDADTVLGEYEQGYMDADAALGQLQSHIEELRDEFEG
ncbi:hypothetical protein [Haloprofundus salinisoli]|uniref:hypothetical protein n=1 Tax=Haloprofundus salinisoli TaxID=2876193 RepID=UPI001CC92F3D|nr:hypothetical protein [Haloprofundus salinisoli]